MANSLLWLLGFVTLLGACALPTSDSERVVCVHNARDSASPRHSVALSGPGGVATASLQLGTNGAQNRGRVTVIHVVNIETNCLVQVIDTSESELLETDGSQLEIADFNFDGWLDFRYPAFRTAGPNTPFQHWLYTPSDRQFRPSNALDALVAPEFHATSRRVLSRWRDGATVYGVDVYRYHGGVLELIETRVARTELDGTCERVHTHVATGAVTRTPCH
ncbi:MAG: hypothetical protein AAF499_06480 [Pseudomonadota bacterium]